MGIIDEISPRSHNLMSICILGDGYSLAFDNAFRDASSQIRLLPTAYDNY